MCHLVVAAALLVALTTPSAAGELSPGDRQRLVAHLEMTEAWLASELHGLSQAQLTFKMTPESWSIMDVVEHLAIAEPQYWQKLRDSMKQPPTTEKMEATDAAILWYGIDRTNRQRTGDARVPHGQFSTAQDALASFRKLRRTMVGMAERTQEDLRGRPFILAEPGTALRETVVNLTQEAGFSPLPLFEVADPQTVRFLVRANLGIAILPASWLERPGPVVGAADLRGAPCHRLSLLTPAAGASPAGGLLAERLLDL